MKYFRLYWSSIGSSDLNDRFDIAKRMSDYVGMINRIAFSVALSYLLNKFIGDFEGALYDKYANHWPLVLYYTIPAISVILNACLLLITILLIIPVLTLTYSIIFSIFSFIPKNYDEKFVLRAISCVVVVVLTVIMLAFAVLFFLIAIKKH